MNLYFEAEVGSSLSEIKQKFDRDLFLKLKPPFVFLELERFDGCAKGDEVHLKTGIPGNLQKWISHITFSEETDKSWLFIDEGFVLPPPLKKWKHEHKVTQIREGVCRISDSIFFDCENAFLNRLLWGPLWLSFSIRPKVYRSIFGSV